MLAAAIVLKKDYDIETLLKSLDGIQNIIILDSGSSNDHLKKVQTISKELGMKLYFYRCKYEHEAQFKNKLLKICNTLDFEYYLLVDCNQVVANSNFLTKFITENKGDCYEMVYETSTLEGIIQRKEVAIIKKHSDWMFVGTVYAKLHRSGRLRIVSVPRDFTLISEVYYQKSEVQLKEDKRIVFEEMDIKEDESSDMDKIEICIETEDWEDVIEHCDSLINSSKSNKEELYRAHLIYAETCLKLDKPWENVFSHLWKAWEIMNTVEPLLYIVRYYLDNSAYLQAYTLLKIANEITYPKYLKQYVKRSDYIYERWKLMQVVATHLKQYDDAYKANQKLLLLQTTERTQNYYNSLVLKETLLENYKNRSSNATIVIYAGETDYYWYGNLKNNTNMGRSQICCVNLAEEFVKHDYHCVVFCNTESSQTVNNVEYLPLTDYDNFMNTYIVNKLIVIDDTNKIKYDMNINSVYVWLQNTLPKGDLIWNEKLKGIIVLTKWHKHQIMNMLPKTFHYLINVISNGVNVKRFMRKKIKRQPRRFIFSSHEDEGLDYLVKIFPTIRGKYPDAELHIYSNVTNESILTQINNYEYIELHERVDQGVLSNKILESDYWLFLTEKETPCCMSAYEMQAGNVFCITTKKGCLENIINDRGLYVERNEKSIMEALNKAETSSMYKKEMLKDGFEWVIEQTWTDMYDIWKDIFNEDEKEDRIFTLNIQIDQKPFKFTLLKNDLIFMRSIIQDNRWEFDICEYLKDKLNEDSTFIEVGGYLGYQSIFTSLRCKQVYVYDIDPDYTEVIQKNVEGNDIKNVKIHCIGLGKERRIVSLWKHSIKKSTLNPEDETEYIKDRNIKCETLDFLYKNRRNEFNQIIVKINANEDNVIHGAKQFIEIYKPILILKEFEGLKEMLEPMRYEFNEIDGYLVCEVSKKRPSSN